MNYIIDGHNLIAKIPGLSLSMPDDEQQLVELLLRYHQGGRGRIEVYFDGAQASEAGVRNYGRVQAHYVIYSSTADQAIRHRLLVLGRASRNWSVVSSDKSVQAAAHEAHAQVMHSETFARMLLSSLHAGSGNNEAKPDQLLSEAEVREWLGFFNQARKKRK